MTDITANISEEQTLSVSLDEGSCNKNKIGNNLTYIEVDTANNEIKLYCNGKLRQKWTE